MPAVESLTHSPTWNFPSVEQTGMITASKVSSSRCSVTVTGSPSQFCRRSDKSSTVLTETPSTAVMMSLTLTPASVAGFFTPCGVSMSAVPTTMTPSGIDLDAKGVSARYQQLSLAGRHHGL